MKVFNRVLAGFAAVLLTMTTFAVPDLVPTRAPAVPVSYHGIAHLAQAVLISAVR